MAYPLEKQPRGQIGLRVPESTNKRLADKSLEMGVSKNMLILTLISIGLKALDDGFNHRSEAA